MSCPAQPHSSYRSQTADVYLEQGWHSSKMLSVTFTLAAVMPGPVQTPFCRPVVLAQSEIGTNASARESMMCSADVYMPSLQNLTSSKLHQNKHLFLLFQPFFLH